MELKYISAKDKAQKQKVSIQHVRTNMMIVDHLTKALQLETFKEHVQTMGLGFKEV